MRPAPSRHGHRRWLWAGPVVLAGGLWLAVPVRTTVARHQVASLEHTWLQGRSIDVALYQQGNAVLAAAGGDAPPERTASALRALQVEAGARLGPLQHRIASVRAVDPGVAKLRSAMLRALRVRATDLTGGGRDLSPLRRRTNLAAVALLRRQRAHWHLGAPPVLPAVRLHAADRLLGAAPAEVGFIGR